MCSAMFICIVCGRKVEAFTYYHCAVEYISFIKIEAMMAYTDQLGVYSLSGGNN